MSTSTHELISTIGFAGKHVLKIVTGFGLHYDITVIMTDRKSVV